MQRNASEENRTLDLQFTRLMHYHCATEASYVILGRTT